MGNFAKYFSCWVRDTTGVQKVQFLVIFGSFWDFPIYKKAEIYFCLYDKESKLTHFLEVSLMFASRLFKCTKILILGYFFTFGTFCLGKMYYTTYAFCISSCLVPAFHNELNSVRSSPSPARCNLPWSHTFLFWEAPP